MSAAADRSDELAAEVVQLDERRGQLPPQNVEAERRVNGSLLLAGGGGAETSAECLRRIRETGLEPGDFYFEKNAIVYRAAESLIERGEACEIILLADEIGRKKLEDIGGEGYLAELLAEATSWTNVGSFAARVIACAQGRTTILPDLGPIVDAARNGGVDIDEAREAVTRAAEKLAERMVTKAAIVTQPATWLKRASDLLAEPDPGPTPYLIDQLAVDQAIIALYGGAKVGKTWFALEIACAIVTGRPALGTFTVPNPGPVIVVLEESGEAALYRRLDALRRGNAQNVNDFEHLHVAANRRVRLNDPRWQEALLHAAADLRPRAIFLDPLVRLKGADVSENEQKELGPVLDFMRLLRDESGSSVAFVHHVGHEGKRMRGSSDLAGYWESAIAITKGDEGQRLLQAEHREAEASETVVYFADFDPTTTSVRLKVIDGSPRERVIAHLADHPDASANDVFKAVGGSRPAVLKIVAELKADGAS